MSNHQSRVAKIEARITSERSSSPSLLHAWCLERHIDAPPPLPGETAPDWLKRVPTEMLKQMAEEKQ